MATQPVWFDEEFYLNSKLQQLQLEGIEGFETVDDVRAAIEASSKFDSVYDHFAQKSLEERTDPNEYFDTTQYLEAKARQLNEIEHNGQTDWTAQSTEEALAAAGFTNAYAHFAQFGWREDVNPSNRFDVSDYLESKAGQLSEIEYEGRTDWTAEQVQEAFINAGTDPVTHFIRSGEGEGLAPSEVPEDEQVPAEVELTLEQAVADAGTEEGLPELYSIDPQQPFTIDDPVSAEAALSTYTTVQEVLDGASNSSALTLDDLFNWSVSDEAANLFDGEEINPDLVDVLAGADAITVTTTVDETQQAALEAINDNVVFEGGFLGEDLALTSGVDYILAPGEPLPEGVTEDMVQRSTENNDTISGVVSTLSSSRTLDAGDQIDAGEGIDTLALTMDGNFTGFNDDGFLRNVENVELTGAGSIARTFDAGGIEDVNNYSLSGNVSLSELEGTVEQIDITNRASGTSTISYASGTVEAGDQQAVGVSGLGTDAGSVTLEVNDVDNLGLTATDENYIALSADDTEAVTIDGAGSLSITDIGSTLQTLDASALQGDLSLVAAVGNDLAINATVTGGQGEDDSLTLTGTGTAQYQMSGIETLNLGALGGTLTFSATGTSGVETIVATDALDDSAEFSTLGDVPMTFELKGDNTTGSITADQTGVSTIEVMADGDENDNQVGLNLSNSTQVDMNVGPDVGYNGIITAGLAEAAVLTFNTKQASAFDLSLGAATTLEATTQDTGDVTLKEDASDVSAVETLTAQVADDSEFKSEANFDSAATVTLSGNGQVTLDNLGADDKDSALTVSAESLENLTIGNMAVATDQSIDLNVANMLGPVNLTGASVGDGTTGSITVDADGTTGALNLGKLEAKDVTVSAKGALKTLEVDATGETIEITGSNLGQNYVTVTADTSSEVTGGLKSDLIDLSGSEGGGKVVAGAGNDYVASGLGSDTITLGGGDDKVLYAEITAGFGDASPSLGADFTYADFTGGFDTITDFSGTDTLAFDTDGGFAGTGFNSITVADDLETGFNQIDLSWTTGDGDAGNAANVSAFLVGNSIAADSTNGEYLFSLDDGTDTYVWAADSGMATGTTDLDADHLTLVAKLEGFDELDTDSIEFV